MTLSIDGDWQSLMYNRELILNQIERLDNKLGTILNDALPNEIIDQRLTKAETTAASNRRSIR